VHFCGDRKTKTGSDVISNSLLLVNSFSGTCWFCKRPSRSREKVSFPIDVTDLWPLSTVSGINFSGPVDVRAFDWSVAAERSPRAPPGLENIRGLTEAQRSAPSCSVSWPRRPNSFFKTVSFCLADTI